MVGQNYFTIREAEALRIFSGKLVLERVPLNRGGYDSAGGYWGIGQPLFILSDPTGPLLVHLRADNRKAALEFVRDVAPRAKIR